MGTIQELRKIKGKRLAHKAASWAQRTYYRNFQRPEADITQHPLYMLLRYYRATEVQSIGKMPIVVTGDSRIHGGEPFFESLIPGCVDTGISGDTSKGVHKRLNDTVLAYDPAIVADDSAGNDILGGAKASQIIPIKRAIASQVRASGSRILFFDVCPLGPKSDPKFNAVILEYNLALRDNFPEEEILPVADLLAVSPIGPMKPEFNSGDQIHHTPLAYTQVYVPELRTRLQRFGFAV